MLSEKFIICCTVILVILGLLICDIVHATKSNFNSYIPTGSYSQESRRPAQKPASLALSPEARISHIVVKFTERTKVRFRSQKLVSENGISIKNAETVLRPYFNGRTRRLFDRFSEHRLDQDKLVFQQRTQLKLADLNSYYRIDISDIIEAEQIVKQLNSLKEVEIAYWMPVPEVAGDIYPPTPDYQEFQDYREAAPVGVDADYANTLPGGDGTGIKIIDIEINWQTTHEDLDKAVGAVIGPYPGSGASSNHGTAVIGEMIASDNEYGMTGICPGADIGMVSISTMSTAQALYTAIDNLQQGDLILIELHAPGPHYDFQSRPDQLGYVCMEYWQANYDAIIYAWAKGLVVVEAAGNGAEDFDDIGLYGQLFDTTYRNSHAIIVGAGYPPSSASDLQKHGYSNFGSRVNLQGYGSGVYTCGYGSLFTGDGDIDQYYTATFSGTSSASPIVTGAAACLQGYYQAEYGVTLTSDMIRDALVTTGTLQLGDTSEHIGPRPDLHSAITTITPPPSLYTLPILIDTTVDEGDIATMYLWLFNRSITETIDYLITDSDSLVRNTTSDWLSVYPQSGSVAPTDSVYVEVTLDASVIVNRIERYIGILEIEWGLTAGPLDSLLSVPVFLTVPCYDSTYEATSSNDPEGPEFNWISARTLGYRLPFNSFYCSGGNPIDDGSVGPKNIGFVFPFYDTSFNRLFIGVNGGISFTDTNLNVNGYFSSFDIPGAPFSTIIAPFWSDLIFDTLLTPDAGIYFYNTPSYDTLVIEWYHPANFNDQNDSSLNFELLLTSNGSIVFQYLCVGTSNLEETALIGISELECRGLCYYKSGDNPSHMTTDSTAVMITFSNQTWVMSGDVDGSGTLDIADLIYLVNYMFHDGTEPIPYEAGDVNCSGDVIDIADLVYLVSYMFSQGDEPCYFWLSQ